MRMFQAVGFLAVLGLLAPVVASAKCDPTVEPDRTDIANARAAVDANCACATATSHGAFVSCAGQQVNAVLTNKSCAGAVKRCASRSTCGRPGVVTCCRTSARGKTSCALKRDATRCRAPKGGHACVGAFASCCDACGATTCVSPTTTSTSTTSTTLPPVCGNNQTEAGEACDGTDSAACLGWSCGPPGVSTACQCCVLTQGTNELPCCNPNAFSTPFPSSQICLSLTCDATFPCALGTCLDGACCSPVGTACKIPNPIFGSLLVPCCPGLQCRDPNASSSSCCVPAGGSCTTGPDCCSNVCTSGTCAP